MPAQKKGGLGHKTKTTLDIDCSNNVHVGQQNGKLLSGRGSLVNIPNVPRALEGVSGL